jgi:beta-galactosidase
VGKLQINTTYLNHDWEYIPDYNESYISEFPESTKIQLPHTNIELPYNNFSEKDYQFVSSYKKTFTFEKTARKRYILHFDGVMEYAEVYLNGKQIVTHKGGYTPFKVEITRRLNKGENTLFVMVDSTERKDIPPYGFVVDYLTYGGIYREVYIEEKEMNYVDNAFIHVENDELNIRMFLDVNTIKDTIFKFNIYKENQLVYFFEREYDLKKNNVLVVEKVFLDLWELDEPNLYELEIIMSDEKAFKSKFANRKIEMTTKGFFLNGKHLKLIGLNRHQSYPYVGYAMPSSAQKLDADILKYELGVNTVRSSHYPPSRYFLDRCDEIGLLVFNEIPGWQHIGDKEWQQVAIENIKEMIYRDYNHPSVFIWGTRINESQDNDEFYQETNRVAKLYDTTRPTGGVRNFAGSHLVEDVYTYNDFLHRGDNAGISKPRSISKKKVPYLVTEYNGHMYPTKKFDDEYHREYQVKRHLKVQNDSFKYEENCGAIGWCMFDYNTHKDFGSGDRISYHGVMDMFRIPKAAAGVYKSQDDEYIFLEVVNSLQIGDREASETKEAIILTNVDSIKFYINEEYVGEFFPSEEYKHLPHPPILIDDFIGSMIHENEEFTDKDADIVKDILLTIMRTGSKLPLLKKIKMRIIQFKYKQSNDQVLKMYDKYVGKWGLESLEYKFEGIKDQLVVITKTVGTSHSNDLYIESDHFTIKETSTYETTRIIIKHLDQNLRPLLYSNEAINISIEGPLKVIGPSNLALVGGSIGLYVKTIGKKGTAKVTISSNNFEDKIIEIEVK